MLTPFPQAFAEVHVVSDLHLGGAEGSQIFAEGAALSGYIGSLVRPGGAPRCLVVNGDFVDFLAEPPARHFDPLDAERKLDRIAQDPAFQPVFAALAAFLAQPNAWLGIVLGNHDVELALPWVRERLLELLTLGQADRRGRCLLSLQGEGLLLQVGQAASAASATVMCVHGNEVDGWNVVEHEIVRRLGRDALRDQRIDEDWIPNAGSRLVIEVMNEIKTTRFAFVDVLKPETAAVLPILFALEPKMLARLNTIAAAAARQAVDRTRIRFGWLGDEDQRPADDAPAARAAPAALRETVRPLLPQVAAGMADELLDRTEQRLAAAQEPLDLIEADRQRDYLGYIGAGWNLIKRDPVEALRQALEGLDKDRSFDPLEADATYRDLHERVSTNIDFLVAGHTHLARAIEREAKRSFYFNTGTWARVFRIDPAVRGDRTRFAALFDGLRTRDMGKLDKLPGLLRVPPHVAVVWATPDAVVGELRSVDGTQVTPVPATRFTRR